MDYLDMEHLSFRFRCEAGVERDFSPIPSEAAIGYQLSLRDDVPPGTEAYWDPDDRSLHFNPCQSQDNIEDDIAHEIDHVVLDDDGMKEDEQEEYAGQLCIFWRIPTHSLHRIYNRHGFVPQRFLEAFHGKASHTQILIRCALGLGVGLIVYNVVGERVASSTDLVRVELDEEEEKYLVETVRRTGQPEPGSFGVWAYPYKHRRRTCVAIVLDLDRCLMRGQRAAE